MYDDYWYIQVLVRYQFDINIFNSNKKRDNHSRIDKWWWKNNHKFTVELINTVSKKLCSATYDEDHLWLVWSSLYFFYITTNCVFILWI